MNKERIELAIMLARRSKRTIGQVAADVAALGRIGRRAVSIAVAQCNYLETDKADRLREPLRRRADAILKSYRLKPLITEDPRGYCFRVLGLPGNTLGGDEDGFGVL